MLRRAAALLQNRLGEVVAVSGFYETAAWGNEHQAPFLNQALIVNTKFSKPEDWLAITKQIETECGRAFSERWGPREIDIDILLAEELVYESAFLSIPHPRLHLRRFCLEPATEIAGDWIHPTFGKSIRELLHCCVDELKVTLMESAS